MDSDELDGYDDFLRDLKVQVQTAQLRAALNISRELALLYWRIGREIVVRLIFRWVQKRQDGKQDDESKAPTCAE